MYWIGSIFVSSDANKYAIDGNLVIAVYAPRAQWSGWIRRTQEVVYVFVRPIWTRRFSISDLNVPGEACECVSGCVGVACVLNTHVHCATHRKTLTHARTHVRTLTHVFLYRYVMINREREFITEWVLLLLRPDG